LLDVADFILPSRSIARCRSVDAGFPLRAKREPAGSLLLAGMHAVHIPYAKVFLTA
jgi:hypothetical protein